MRTASDLFEYQKRAVDFQCSKPESALWLDMGLGKTVITLTSIGHLINCGIINAVVIVAPVRVCRLVWRQEALKWAHTKGLTFSMVMGNKDQRTRALLQKADVYLINYENLGWLAENLHTYFINKDRPLPFNGLVWDEISKCKNSATQRVKSIKKILSNFVWKTGLTGTPASNGYKDLHGQYLVLDEGRRLGVSKTQFKTRFYRKISQYKEVAYDDTEELIKSLIGDMTLEMSAADYNPLPDLIVNEVEVELSDDLRKLYDKMEKDFFIALDSGAEVEMFNQASLTNKCLAEGTEVLTDEGWKTIEKCSSKNLFWDGVEWVSAFGIKCNGYMPTVECWGVNMTSDHKLLTVSGWKQAQEILNDKPSERNDRYEVRLPGSNIERREHQGRKVSKGYMEGKVYLWKGNNNSRIKFKKSKSNENEVVWLSPRGNNSYAQYDKYSSMDYLAKYAFSVQCRVRQGFSKLWRTWNKSVQGVGRVVYKILGGFRGSVPISHDDRTKRRKPWIFQGQRQMGKSEKARKQYKKQCIDSNTYREDNSCTGISKIQSETDNNIPKNNERVGRERSTITRVYDIVNCGKRHRFTVRGKDGIPFISHNCLQFSNGAMYPVAGMPLWEAIHDIKLDALEEIIDEAQGQPILCSYSYRSDAERIMIKFAHLNPINLTECKSEKSLLDAMARWKSGDCPLMIGHPASMGHGVDGLQDKGHILVWFGLNWSLDLYEQFNARIRRQGQGAPVICHRILCKDTLDEAQSIALADKATTQNGLRAAIKSYRACKS